MKNRKRRHPSLWLGIMGVCLLTISLPAAALTVGDVEVKSKLNEPLKAVIPLTASDAELAKLEVKLGSADAFRRAGLEMDKSLYALKFRIIRDAKAPHILLTTEHSVREPMLEFVMTVRWARGRMLRQVALFLSP